MDDENMVEVIASRENSFKLAHEITQFIPDDYKIGEILSGLVIAIAHVAIIGKVKKPHLLANVSTIWEEVDDMVSKNEDLQLHIKTEMDKLKES